MIKTLAKSIRQYKKATIAAMVFVSLDVIMEIIIPLVMARLLDQGIEAGNMDYVLKASMLLLMLAITQVFFGVNSAREGAKAAAGFAANLRNDMYERVQNFSFSNIDKFSTASIITRLTTDVTNVQFTFQMVVRLILKAPLMMIFALFVSLGISKEISLVFFACIPFLALGLGVLSYTAHPIFERVFKRYDDLNNVVQENVRGIRVVKTFVRSDFEKSKFDNMSRLIYKEFSKAEKIIAGNIPVMQIASYGCIIMISWLGAKAVVASGNNAALGLTTGDLMSLIMYAQHILISLMVISIIFVMIAISRASAERITELLQEESDIKNCENPVYEVKDGEIEFVNVTFKYGKDKKANANCGNEAQNSQVHKSEAQHNEVQALKERDKVQATEKSIYEGKNALRNINLNIKSGETVGILGGTGSAKSSLVQLIPRLYDVTSGSLFVGGVDVREYDLNTLRNAVALVLQKNELFTGTIKENLRWGNEYATDEEIIHACKLARADEFINKMPKGYDTHIEQGGNNVSGGQKQRLCIARALLKKPKILILDDSTSAVDTNTDGFIQKSFMEYIPETTKIIIAQRVSSVQHSDKILIMDNGEIIQMGKHEELLQKSEIYRELYESQQKGGEEYA